MDASVKGVVGETLRWDQAGGTMKGLNAAGPQACPVAGGSPELMLIALLSAYFGTLTDVLNGRRFVSSLQTLPTFSPCVLNLCC